jgi:hypothetical protein
MQAGVDKWETAGFLGAMLDRVYGHHRLNHLRSAARTFGGSEEPESLANRWQRQRCHDPTDLSI